MKKHNCKNRARAALEYRSWNATIIAFLILATAAIVMSSRAEAAEAAPILELSVKYKFPVATESSRQNEYTSDDFSNPGYTIAVGLQMGFGNYKETWWNPKITATVGHTSDPFKMGKNESQVNFGKVLFLFGGLR